MTQLLSRVAGTLDEARINFAVIGASAMAVHGVSRSTLDIDLMTIDPTVLSSSTWRRLEGEGVEVVISHGDAQDPLRGVVRFEAEGNRPIDLIVGHGGWQRLIFERSTANSIGGVEVPVASIVDLVLLKLYAAGPQDLWDIKQLLDNDLSINLQTQVSTALESLPAEMAASWSKVIEDR